MSIALPACESPAVKAGLFRVYVIVDNYRTNLDDYREVYLLGIQMHSRTIKTAPRT